MFTGKLSNVLKDEEDRDGPWNVELLAFQPPDLAARQPSAEAVFDPRVAHMMSVVKKFPLV